MSDTNNRRQLDRIPPRPLPATKQEMLDGRKGERLKTLNDHVEDLHIVLFRNPEHPEYDRFLDAVYDEDAVEGSLAADNLEAARMLRGLATKDDRDLYVADKKLATISKALGVVLRRYGISRKERSRTIDGMDIGSPNDTNNDF